MREKLIKLSRHKSVLKKVLSNQIFFANGVIDIKVLKNSGKVKLLLLCMFERFLIVAIQKI